MSREAIEKRRIARWGNKPSAEERFWPKVNKGPDCWEWIGAKRGDGYGLFWSGQKVVSAHLESLKLAGVNIPKGMVADHMCSNRACVRPEHLRIVTPRQNALENNPSPFAHNSKLTHCKYGHEFTPENTAIGRAVYVRRPGVFGTTRICLTCRPHLWKYAVIERPPPPRSKLKWCGPFKP